MASGVTAALDKLFYLDTGLTIDAYLQSTIAEYKRAAEKAQTYAARMEEKVAEIEVLSRTDPLTGLLNRRAFLEELRKELHRAMRHAEPVCLAYIDVDNFKSINDGLGHAKGDEQLALIARALSHDLRKTDFVCRFGGDEFCITFSGATLDQARMATDRFLARLRKVTVSTVSIGIASTGPIEFLESESFIAEADKAMLRAKLLRVRPRIDPACHTPLGAQQDWERSLEHSG
jgi:diguanylate cyclase (GGDEF)-like protein